MGTTALRRLGYVVGLFVLATAFLWLQFGRLAASPYVRGIAEGATMTMTIVVMVGNFARLRDARRRRRADEVELAGRKARWLAKHPDSVVGRGGS
ncbi:MAG: hypothetical protein JNM10_10575 [Planctomycetia bacterium]|nr:hypothetical protein [Planctomycetia bacterium]